MFKWTHCGRARIIEFTRMLPRWFRFVALFMMSFVLFDVCTPEPCVAQIPPATQSGATIQLQYDSSGDTCQFEEDCFGCAHFAPGAVFVLHPAASIITPLSISYLSMLAGIPVIPYHPPRS